MKQDKAPEDAEQDMDKQMQSKMSIMNGYRYRRLSFVKIEQGKKGMCVKGECIRRKRSKAKMESADIQLLRDMLSPSATPTRLCGSPPKLVPRLVIVGEAGPEIGLWAASRSRFTRK